MRTWIGRETPSACNRDANLVLSERDENAPGILRSQRQEVVVRAAHAAHADRRITRIHVVLNERPPYDEIARFRQVAEDQDLDMAVDGSGMVSMWRHDESGTRRDDR